MYSPKDRLYNTPEMTGPTGDAVLQQIRLESILRKYGRLACCEPYVYSSKNMTRKLPELKAPLRSLKPFEEQREMCEKVNRGIEIPNKDRTGHLDKSSRHHFDNAEALLNRNKRSAIPGAPTNDPYLQKPRDTVGGGKYGGANLGEFASNGQNPELFRPFYPQKTPRRLPCIQREKSKIKDSTSNKMSMLLISKDTELAHHMSILKRQRSHELAKLKFKETKRRQKKSRLENEFHKWEQAQDAYLQKVHSLDSDYQILKNHEKFHDVRQQSPDAEQTQRTRISNEIERGVQRKLKMLRHDDETVKEKIVPVCNMTFEKHRDIFYLDKTTVPVTQGTKKKKAKKKHAKDKKC